ncbi:FRG domain-containing protein [Sulfuricurvum sp.]|uniref:FRG domain-containing protein n=1 Tax=Sulfuricurvum sp. TaxID=2025608 RepID=UPI002625F275|nr:FRG domain-containing protein [Sulfuricurvum sp.]MDD3597842.1 FRG domain-containing protein [Sulfuricurvum sp.]
MDLSGFDIINAYLTKIKQIIMDSEINEDFEIFYRGEGSNYEKTLPGIFHSEGIQLENEHKLFRELELRYPNIFDGAKSTIDKLAIMQHYGLSTRLLDFTTNPLLALYMALDNNPKTPTIKIIFVKKDAIKYYDSDTVSIFANFAKSKPPKIEITKKEILWIIETMLEYYDMEYEDLTNSEKEIIGKKFDEKIEKIKDDEELKKLFEYLKQIYDADNENVEVNELAKFSIQLQQNDPKYAFAEGFNYAVGYTHSLLHLIKDEKPYFKDLIWVEHFDTNVIFVKPKHNSQRIINQAGLFALFGLKNGQKESYSLEDFENNSANKDKHFKMKKFTLCECVEDLCTDDYIKHTKKALGILGITKDRVYPEMENASKYIKELFMTK